MNNNINVCINTKNIEPKEIKGIKETLDREIIIEMMNRDYVKTNTDKRMEEIYNSLELSGDFVIIGEAVVRKSEIVSVSECINTAKSL